MYNSHRYMGSRRHDGSYRHGSHRDGAYPYGSHRYESRSRPIECNFNAVLSLYPVPREEMIVLQDREMRAEHPAPMSLREAVHVLRQINDHRSPLMRSRSREIAIANLSSLMAESHRFRSIQIYPIALAIFNDLDRAFFDGTLKDKVCVRSRTPRPSERLTFGGATASPGELSWRASIEVDSEPPGDGSCHGNNEHRLKNLVATMLHEMVLAHLVVGSGLEVEELRGRHGHRSNHRHRPLVQDALATIQTAVHAVDWDLDLRRHGQYSHGQYLDVPGRVDLSAAGGWRWTSPPRGSWSNGPAGLFPGPSAYHR